jgi:hypothetical protein
MCFLRFLTCKQAIFGLFLFDLGTFIGGLVALSTPTSEITSKFLGTWMMIIVTMLWCLAFMVMDFIMFRNVIPEDFGDEEAQRKRREGNILHSGIWLLILFQFIGSLFLIVLHAACNNSEVVEMIKETKVSVEGHGQGTTEFYGGDFGTFFQFSWYCIPYCIAKMCTSFACLLSTERQKYIAIPDK